MTDAPLPFFSHPHAIVESRNIGRGTKIWAFAHVLPGAVIGEDCNICDYVFIENDVIVGDRVTVKCGVQLWDGVHLDNDVFVGPNATFTNDAFPRSKQPFDIQPTRVLHGASIGANATVLPGITIGHHAMVGAGAVVTKDVPPYATVAGNPARITGYAETKVYRSPSATSLDSDTLTLRVKGAALYSLPILRDLRGALSFAEIDRPLPFVPKRYFVIFDVPSVEVRGEHAHKTLHEFLVCLKGSCEVVLDDGSVRDQVLLNDPGRGLHIPPMVWSTQYKYSTDAILLVMASHVYDADDYIRDYDSFVGVLRERR
jgi:UDP-2-acetamido-3-amino-2,3-dideoxy-glucuronate N-acetyltransferase